MKEAVFALICENPIRIAKVQEALAAMNIVDVGDIFEDMSMEHILQIFRLLPKDVAANVFAHIVPEKQQVLVEALTDKEVGHIIEGLFMDDAVDFIEEMPANVVNRVLRNATPERRNVINRLLNYPEDSVGSIMTTEYMALREDYTVMEAFARMREERVRGIHTCYIVRRDKILLGAVSLKSLLLAKEHVRVGDLVRTQVISAQTHDDQEEAAGLFRKYDFLSLPVVDKENRLVGIITVDDMVEIVEEEATEDFELMAGIIPSEEPYLRTGVFKHSRGRIGWLMVLMLAAILTEMILGDYENNSVLLLFPVLGWFIPLLMGAGGNAGSQAATLVIRSMALDEIRFKDIFKVWWLEIRIALICGLILGTIMTIGITLFTATDFMVTLTVASTLVLVSLLAKSLGSLLPILGKRAGIDPAVFATPMLTTLKDAITILVYFSLARLILGV
ncbi:MAG: magnesium transporter [Defluviitaleaceae bacterium]|nr:magnesium transporter [Defluviitaleaceae bacterium]MCL2238482.1 magnesium transporter [Defluviitaleaceae bacterium]